MAALPISPVDWLSALFEKSPDTALERARKAQEAAVGVLDATGAVGSGLVNQAIGGAVALPWTLVPGVDSGKVLADTVGRLPQYQPRTEYGKELLGAMAAPGGLGEKIDAPFRWVGEKGQEAATAAGLPAEVAGLAGSLAYTGANLVGPVEAYQAARALPGIVARSADEAVMGGATSQIWAGRVLPEKRQAYKAAREAGTSDVEAFAATGVFEAPDGTLREWIPDADMILQEDIGRVRKDSNRNEVFSSTTVGDRIIHDPLLERYPELADLKLAYREGMEPKAGGLSWKADGVGGKQPSQLQVGTGKGGVPVDGTLPAGGFVPDEAQTILHELQHSVDILDYGEGGTSPDTIPAPPELLQQQLENESIARRAMLQGEPFRAKEAMARAADIEREIRQAQFRKYKTNSGEAFARATESLYSLGVRTPEELLNQLPSGPTGALDVDPKTLWFDQPTTQPQGRWAAKASEEGSPDYTVVPTWREFKAIAERNGDELRHGNWAFTDAAGKTYVLDEAERRALGGKVSTDQLVAHERAIRAASAADPAVVQRALAEARAGRGDAEAAALARAIDAGRHGPMNDATAGVEVYAVALRNRSGGLEDPQSMAVRRANQASRLSDEHWRPGSTMDVKVREGNTNLGISAIKNPTIADMRRFVQGSEWMGPYRWNVDLKTGDLVVWDAGAAIHRDVQDSLGMTDGYTFGNNSEDGNLFGPDGRQKFDATTAEGVFQEIEHVLGSLEQRGWGDRVGKARSKLGLDRLEEPASARAPGDAPTLRPADFTPVAPKDFDAALAAARDAMVAGGDTRSALQVDAKLPDDFQGKVYMSPDGLSGFAVSDTGYVSNLFKHPSAAYRDVMGAVLARARAEGGKTLDAFDTGLAAGYAKRGAVETGRSPWNPEYAPAGWDTEKMGTPDYVSMNIGTTPTRVQVPPERLAVSSIPTLYDNNVAALKRGANNVVSLAKKFSQAAKQVWGRRDMTVFNERNVNDVGTVLAAEAEAAMQKTGHAGTWYSDTLDDAHAVADLVYGNVMQEPAKKTAFNFALAITSNGQLVKGNSRLAHQAFQEYLKTGRFPVIGQGKEAGAMKTAFRTYNQLADTFGEEAVQKFLNTEYTVGELKAAGFNIADESVDLRVPGAAIFGPKIGGGFFANLQGDFSRLTADRWLTRTMSRIVGDIYQPNPKLLNKQLGVFRQALIDAGETPPKTDVALKKLAVARHKAFMKGDETGSYPVSMRNPANNAARNIAKSMNPAKESPSNGTERNYYRAIAQRAVEKLREQGIETTVSDLQALVWYPEQDLYKKLGYNAKPDQERDYLEAFKAIAREAGVSQEQIDSALRGAGERRVAARGNERGADPAGVRAPHRRSFESRQDAGSFLEGLIPLAKQTKGIAPAEKRAAQVRSLFSD
jgi:hypothetical protein